MKNSKVILFTIFLTIIFLVTLTFYKIGVRHLELSIHVVEKRIIEGAKTCVWEDKCLDSFVTLQELIQMGYLKDEVNPKTKMYYNTLSYVEWNNDEYKFVVVD